MTMLSDSHPDCVRQRNWIMIHEFAKSHPGFWLNMGGQKKLTVADWLEHAKWRLECLTRRRNCKDPTHSSSFNIRL